MGLINNKNMTLKVLVVDDEAISRQISAKMVEAQGMDVETASNGQEAFSQWQDNRYPLIIADCYMPIMDGFQMAQSVRRIETSEQCEPTIIIALTANTAAEEHDRCMEAGMDGLMTKPVTIAKLTPLIANVLAASSKDTAHRATLDHETKSIDQTLVNLSVLAEVFPDRSKQATVLSDLQQHVKANLNELKQAINHAELANIERIAHRMKGACKMVGVNGIANICSEIESMAKNGDIAQGQTLMNLGDSIQQFDAFLLSQFKPIKQS